VSQVHQSLCSQNRGMQSFCSNAAAYGHLCICCLGDGTRRMFMLVLLFAYFVGSRERPIRRRGAGVSCALPAQGAAVTAMTDFTEAAEKSAHVPRKG
jgi:hypothetical protein